MDDRTFGNPHHEVRVIQALQKPLHRHLFWLLEGYPAYGGSIRSFPMVQISQNNHLGCIKPCTSSDMCIYLPYQLVSRISGASTVSRRYPVVCFKSKVLKWTLQKIDEFLIWNPQRSNGSTNAEIPQTISCANLGWAHYVCPLNIWNR